MRYKIFAREGMIHPPSRGDYFRVGWWTGSCLIVNRWFVVMDKKGKLKFK